MYGSDNCRAGMARRRRRGRLGHHRWVPEGILAPPQRRTVVDGPVRVVSAEWEIKRGPLVVAMALGLAVMAVGVRRGEGV
jgi:hypothetical protein